MKQSRLILLLTFAVVLSAQNINIESLSLIPKCVSDTNCLPGWFCLNSKCTDRCALMRCVAGTICKDGACNSVCTLDPQCPVGFICNGQYCVDNCRFTKCSEGTFCVKGKCLNKCSTAKDCLAGFYCSNKFVCEDKCLQTNPCSKSQNCVAGQCVPIIVEPVCTELIQCSDPRPTQKTCPTLTWIKKPDPVVCGVDQNSQIVDFPVKCYACKNTSILSYFNQRCDKIPPKCIKQAIGDLQTCNLNEILIDGQCTLRPTFPDKFICKEPRPDDKTCPTVYWFRAPDSVACGVDGNGKYIDFPIECYACKQKDIVFYYNTTCDKIKRLSCASVKCSSNSKCIAGVCVPNTIWPICNKNAKKINCQKVRPTEKTCPTLQWIVAPQNIVCGVTAIGQRISYPVQCYACKNSDVAYYYNQSCDYLSTPCSQDPTNCKTTSDCAKGFFCYSGVCKDNCMFMKCQAGTSCLKGVCEPDITSCALIKCQSPKKCLNGACVDACMGIMCIATKTCVNGECVPIVVEKV